MNNINIGIAVDVPKLLKTRMLFQAGSGGGKSYGLRKVIESIGNKAQQIIIDPEGEFASLREKFDFLLVGKDGDIPLNVRYAETLANMILETGISVIIDLYELKQPDRILFVKRFLEAMINAEKNLWHACFIYIDEAHIFCPEDKKADSTQAVIDLCTRGRKRGYCAILATQRLPVLNKNATAQCYNKIIGLNTQDIDRKRAGEELGMITKADFLSLRDLDPGEFYAFGPAISKEILKFKIDPVVTSHLESGTQLSSMPPTPKAIAKILSKFSDIPVEAEKELATKQQLQAEVTRLRAELTRASKMPTPAGKPPVQNAAALQKTIDTAVNQARLDMRAHYTAVIKERDGIILSAQGQLRKLQGIIHKINELSGGGAKMEVPMPAIPSVPKIAESDKKSAPTVTKPAESEEKAVQRENSGNESLSKCARMIISFLASHEDRDFTKAQISVATGYSSTSSSFGNAMGELNTKGFIIRGSRIKVNIEAIEEIVKYIGDIVPVEFKADTFKDKLGKCELEIYEVLLDRPRDTFTKESLAAETPSRYSPTSSSYQNSLGRLNSLELIRRGNGTIQLNPELLELL